MFRESQDRSLCVCVCVVSSIFFTPFSFSPPSTYQHSILSPWNRHLTQPAHHITDSSYISPPRVSNSKICWKKLKPNCASQASLGQFADCQNFVSHICASLNLLLSHLQMPPILPENWPFQLEIDPLWFHKFPIQLK